MWCKLRQNSEWVKVRDLGAIREVFLSWGFLPGCVCLLKKAATIICNKKQDGLQLFCLKKQFLLSVISFLNKQWTDSGLSKPPPNPGGATNGESKAHRDGSSLIKVSGPWQGQEPRISLNLLKGCWFLGLNGTIRGHMIQLLSPWKTASMGAVTVWKFSWEYYFFGLPQKHTYRAKVIMEKNVIYLETKPFIVRALPQGMRIFNIPTWNFTIPVLRTDLSITHY